MNRRAMLAGAAIAGAITASPIAKAQPRTARFKQGAARSVFGSMPLEDCLKLATPLGITGFDFISNPADWPLLRRYGAVCSMLRADYPVGVSEGRGPGGPEGWSAVGLKAAQGAYLDRMHELIDAAAREGIPNIIFTAGTRDHVTYEQGAENAVEWGNKIKAHAEQKGVTLCMEILNSTGVMGPINSLFDKSAWGFDVVRRINSPKVKVLYDIWHAQLMEGNIVATLRANIDWIGHIHTGGVPGRHELHRNNELDYRFIAQVLAELGYDGYVVHEWSPSPGSDIADNLQRTVALMRV